jgi:hypothetical protein
MTVKKRLFCGLAAGIMTLMLAGFAGSVWAVDAKFSGSYYIQGSYVKNHSLLDPNEVGGSTGRGSTAFYNTRLRMGIDFQVAKGLKLGTRFDALERRWMAARLAVPTSNGYKTTDSEQENIGFEMAYADFETPIGRWFVGSFDAGAFGPSFANEAGYAINGIRWIMPMGPWTFSAMMKKNIDGAGTTAGMGTDNDYDQYDASVVYKWKGGDTGFMLTYLLDSRNASYKSKMPVYNAYVRHKAGMIFAEFEADMVTGDYRKYNQAGSTDISVDMALRAYLNVNADLSPVKMGAMFVYSKGDDPNTADKKEGSMQGLLGTDRDKNFNPCLILFNNDYTGTLYFGNIRGNAANFPVKTYLDNVWLYQVYGDYTLSKKTKVGASYTYAYADKKPTASGAPASASNREYVSDKYGSELDVTATYKIYDNLEYMIGAAYLWAGDYFKGVNPNAKLKDNYFITHKLTLSTINHKYGYV